MVQQRIHRCLVAVDQVEHAGGQPGLVQQFDGAGGRQRHFFRRLQDEGVAAGDGEGVHPHGHHGGEIERRDAGADADGLADGLAVDAGGDIVERIAHHQAGHAAGHFHHLDGAAHFGPGVFGGLAVFAGEDGGQIVGVFFEQRLVAIEHLHAVDHRHVAPFQERRVRGADGAVDVGGVGVGHFGDDGAGGRDW